MPRLGKKRNWNGACSLARMGAGCTMSFVGTVRRDVSSHIVTVVVCPKYCSKREK